MISIFKNIFKKKKDFKKNITYSIYDELKVFNPNKIYHVNYLGDSDIFYLFFNKYIYYVSIFDNFICLIKYKNIYNLKNNDGINFYKCVNFESEKFKSFIKIKDEEQAVAEIKKYFKNEYRIKKIKEII